ncbi:putative hydrolase [Yersinia enterocolitica]|uniref:Hydrolase n=1 Tax=Yersinia enterocolitica TaxID=630 RepID=A0ABP1XY53_YEREN|nr:putative hydrolase [Yersinia enterocolitica]CQD67024.1 putative hydrolase [Yersinia enterocolitica]CRX81352.1 putative hydrolase [Yersinia enterocolitica]
MIKLIITDLDGTFLDKKGDYNREMFQVVKKIMVQKGVHFAICTGKQCERVEELFKGDAEQFWILGDSATRIKYKGEYVYQSLIKNQLGLNIISKLEAINKEPVIIACTTEGAFIKNSISKEMESKIKKSYAKVTKVDDFYHMNHDLSKYPFMTKRVAALFLNLIFMNSLIKPISLFLKMPGLILPISACIKGIQSKSYRIY